MADGLNKFKSWYESTFTHPANIHWRKHAKEDFEYYDGDQFSPDDMAELEQRGQPIIEVNKILPKMNNLMGAHGAMRARHVAKARNESSTDSADAISDVFRYIDYRSSYPDEEGDMFQDGILSGIGWMEAVQSVDEDGEDELLIEYEETFNMGFDPLSRNYDLDRDCRFVWRHKWMDLEDAIELLPEHEAKLKQAVAQGETINAEEHGNTTSFVERGPDDDFDSKDASVSYIDKNRERIKIVELWYKTKEKVIFDSENNYVPDLSIYRGMNDNRVDELVIEEAGMREVNITVTKRVFFSSDMLLGESMTPWTHPLNIGKYPFFRFFCFRKKSGTRKGEPYGYVRQMKPMQKEINKRRSKALHLLNTTRIIMDEGAVDDVDELRDEAARPDAVIEKKTGKDLVLENGATLANSQFSIMEKSSNDLQEVSGIFDESIGAATNARSGKAIGKRIMASNQNNIKVFTNLRRTRKKVGEFMLGAVKQLYTNERILYIADDEGIEKPKNVELNKEDTEGNKINDIQTALVKLVIDDAPSSLTVQEEQFDTLALLAQSGVPIPPVALIMASSLRDKEKILKLMQPSPNKQNPDSGPAEGDPNA